MSGQLLWVFFHGQRQRVNLVVRWQTEKRDGGIGEIWRTERRTRILEYSAEKDGLQRIAEVKNEVAIPADSVRYGTVRIRARQLVLGQVTSFFYLSPKQRGERGRCKRSSRRSREGRINQPVGTVPYSRVPHTVRLVRRIALSEGDTTTISPLPSFPFLRLGALQ